jgi:hypothetical protein
MIQIYNEGGAFALLFASIFFLFPVYLLIRAITNKSKIQKSIQNFKQKPLESALTVCMIIGYTGFVLWVFSDGYFSSGFFGIIGFFSWVIYELAKKRKLD